MPHPPPAGFEAWAMLLTHDDDEFVGLEVADRIRVACGRNGGVTLKMLDLEDQVLVAGGLDAQGARRLAAELTRAADQSEAGGGRH